MHTLKDIEESVCIGFGVTSWDIHTHSRKRKFSRPRMAVYFLARELTTLSYQQISSSFGHHHTSVINAVATVKRLVEENGGMARRIERTREILATITPYRARLAELVAANPIAERPKQPAAEQRAGDRRRRVVEFAQANGSAVRP
jgi:Bacterial dnaA protein helix-turn-helix